MARILSSSQSGNNFAFIIVNRQGQDDNQSSPTPKAIRSHVTREARRQKKAGESASRPERETPLPFQTGRFRLGLAESKSKVLNSSKQIGSDASSKTNLKDDRDVSAMAMETISKWPRQLQPSHLLDPFNSLPVTLGSRQQSLLYYYDRHFVQNGMAFNPPRKYLKIAAVDPAWLNATFALLALSFNLHTGAAQKITADTLYYRGQALRLVNERLSKPSQDVEDATFGAIATLCNFDIMSGSLVTATAHITGLEQLLKMRGGIEKLPTEQKTLLYVISWCDMAYVTSWGGTPRFPELSTLAMPPESHISSCPQDETLLPHDRYVEHCPVGRSIYHLSSLLNSGLTVPQHREIFSQTLYSTQHTLLQNLSALLKAASTPPATPEGSEHTEGATPVADGIDESISRRAALIANNLYIDLALRQLVPQADMHTIVASRLKDVLCLLAPPSVSPMLDSLNSTSLNSTCSPNSPANTILLHWNDAPARLLWVAFIGGAASAGPDPDRVELRQFFVSLLVQVRDDLMLVDLEQMRVVLKLFGWVEAWAGEHSQKLWGEMEWWSVNEVVGATMTGEVDEDREEDRWEEKGEMDAEWEVDDEVVGMGDVHI